jgi:hypothetical protein
MRPADFAYQGWYPYTEENCLRQIHLYEKKVSSCPSSESQGRGGIVPHAGWAFSGQLAFHVISCLLTGKKPDTIVIFGKHSNPSQDASRRRNSIMLSGQWETPLGSLTVDSDLADYIQKQADLVVETEDEYEFDNTIEVQLPFLKYIFPDVKILPLGVVEPTLESLSLGSLVIQGVHTLHRKVKLLATTDMTHYGPGYGFSPKGMGEQAVNWVEKNNDKKMIDLFLHMKSEEILTESAQNRNCCCPAAVASMITALKEINVHNGVLLDYFTSYSIRPSADFVGYAGVLY